MTENDVNTMLIIKFKKFEEEKNAPLFASTLTHMLTHTLLSLCELIFKYRLFFYFSLLSFVLSLYFVNIFLLTDFSKKKKKTRKQNK